MTEYTYVDVAAVRIQTWLGRTARLRLRRGASYRLTELTSQKAIADLFQRLAPGQEPPSGLGWNPEAGEVSGVVALRFPAADMNEDEVRRNAGWAARIVTRHLRARLPACPVVATWGLGPSYVEGYLDMQRRAADGDLLVDNAGAPEETVLARPCGCCRRAAAVWLDVEVIAGPDGWSADFCRDCAERLIGAGRMNPPDLRRLPTAQRQLRQGIIDHFSRLGVARLSFPQDFQDLAARGDGREGDAATHLALIYADGNGIGAHIKRWLANGGNAHESFTRLMREDGSRYAAHRPSTGGPIPVPKNLIVPALDRATKAALVTAYAATFGAGPRQDKPPVIVHVAGGDDVMVSVPALDAWPFVRALLEAFRAQCGATVPYDQAPYPTLTPDSEGLVPSPLTVAFGAGKLSLSAGIVFHHFSHPISDVVEKAEAMLGQAKRDRYREAAVAFHDLTSDGEHTPDLEATPDAHSRRREAVQLADLNRWATRLDGLSASPRSHRAMLTALLRQAVDASQEPLEPGEAPDLGARDALARRVVEIGDQAVTAVVRQGPGPKLGQDNEPGTKLAHGEPTSRDHLRLMLDIARWWTPGLDPTVRTEAR